MNRILVVVPDFSMFKRMYKSRVTMSSDNLPDISMEMFAILIEGSANLYAITFTHPTSSGFSRERSDDWRIMRTAIYREMIAEMSFNHWRPSPNGVTNADILEVWISPDYVWKQHTGGWVS